MHPYLASQKPIILAHRGDSARAPQNTMLAFQLAVEGGADALETDIHWTKDGVIVVCHDDKIDDVSDGAGKIQGFTFAELQQFDFGWTYSPDGGRTYPFRGLGLQIPTLEDVLTSFPSVCVNMDIKPSHPVSIRQLIQEIYACRAEQRVLVASFHHPVLAHFRACTREIVTSASVLETASFLARTWMPLPAGDMNYLALQVPVSAHGIPVVTETFLKQAHKFGKKVHVWTVNDPEDMTRLFRMGVDGIVTDNPRLALEVRNHYLRESTA